MDDIQVKEMVRGSQREDEGEDVQGAEKLEAAHDDKYMIYRAKGERYWQREQRKNTTLERIACFHVKSQTTVLFYFI